MPVNQATPRLGSLTSFFVAPLSVFFRPPKRLNMPDCLISFGSNLGDRLACLSQAAGLLKAVPGVERVRVSQPLETVPVGGPSDQPAYLNAALRCATTLSAGELHQQLLSIETSLGRVRVERWGSRTADLDLLLYDQQQMTSEFLTIPHHPSQRAPSCSPSPPSRSPWYRGDAGRAPGDRAHRRPAPRRDAVSA